MNCGKNMGNTVTGVTKCRGVLINHRDIPQEERGIVLPKIGGAILHHPNCDKPLPYGIPRIDNSENRNRIPIFPLKEM